MNKYIRDDRIHEGHRSRMRAKLFEHGQHIFDTYELLEMLLYHVIPYKDTNPVAKRLLAAFGGLDGVFKASEDELSQVEGVGKKTAEFIHSVSKLSYILGAEILLEPAEDFGNYETVGRFFVNYFSNIDTSCVVALFLDNNMRPIELKQLYDVDYDSGGVRAKAFIDAAILNHASVVISAHNHPHGPFYPTQGDRATNNEITSSLRMMGLVHAEHYIICGESYAGIGSIRNFTNRSSNSDALNQFMAGKERTMSAGRVCAINHCRDYSAAEIEPRYNRRDFDYFASLISYATGDDGTEAARRLLIRYHTIENVITATVQEISKLSSEKTAFLIKLLGYISSRRVTDEFAFGTRYSRADIADYFKALFIGDSVEKIYIMTFDPDDNVTGCKMISEGTVNSSEVMPRKAAEVAIGAHSSAVAIAHNHPFGNITPSDEDYHFTGVFETIFSSCGIKLLGHYIIAGQRCRIISSSKDKYYF